MTRSTSSIVVEFLESAIFQLTTSRRGRPQKFPFKNNKGYFNSRPHEEVDQRYVRHRNFFHHFNSRPHEEVDVSTAGDESYGNISTHDLTKRSTFLRRPSSSSEVFQLTTSRRGRHKAMQQHNFVVEYFNSRPHEEVDN